MDFSDLQQEMRAQLVAKELFAQAQSYAYDYIDNLAEMDVFPFAPALADLEMFEETLPAQPASPAQILGMLHQYGSKATVAQTGGKYFGFVNGSAVPVALAAKWLADVWDQNAALFVMSPITAKLEAICEKWLVQLFKLPPDTAAAFVGGSSLAGVYALAAARNELLNRQGWDVGEQGLFGAPPLKVVLGGDAHSSVFKALSLLGLGKSRVELVPVDAQGRMLAGKLPKLDSATLVIAQAGNVCGGAFDPLDEICDAANQARAWVHVDGAFGLWAAAAAKTSYLTKGMEKADSWSVDAHKTLNAPYDCGIVLCKERAALVNSMRAAGSYIQFSAERDAMSLTPEMSRRGRGVELWATLKYLGQAGVASLVEHLCSMAQYFAHQLAAQGFIILTDVVFNQIVVKCATPEATAAALEKIQASGKCWCGGAVWQNQLAIRVSVCSWQTDKEDIDDCVKIFAEARK